MQQPVIWLTRTCSDRLVITGWSSQDVDKSPSPLSWQIAHASVPVWQYGSLQPAQQTLCMCTVDTNVLPMLASIAHVLLTAKAQQEAAQRAAQAAAQAQQMRAAGPGGLFLAPGLDDDISRQMLNMIQQASRSYPMPILGGGVQIRGPAAAGAAAAAGPGPGPEDPLARPFRNYQEQMNSVRRRIQRSREQLERNRQRFMELHGRDPAPPDGAQGAAAPPAAAAAAAAAGDPVAQLAEEAAAAAAAAAAVNRGPSYTALRNPYLRTVGGLAGVPEAAQAVGFTPSRVATRNEGLMSFLRDFEDDRSARNRVREAANQSDTLDSLLRDALLSRNDDMVGDATGTVQRFSSTAARASPGRQAGGFEGHRGGTGAAQQPAEPAAQAELAAAAAAAGSGSAQAQVGNGLAGVNRPGTPLQQPLVNTAELLEMHNRTQARLSDLLPRDNPWNERGGGPAPSARATGRLIMRVSNATAAAAAGAAASDRPAGDRAPAAAAAAADDPMDRLLFSILDDMPDMPGGPPPGPFYPYDAATLWRSGLTSGAEAAAAGGRPSTVAAGLPAAADLGRALGARAAAEAARAVAGEAQDAAEAYAAAAADLNGGGAPPVLRVTRAEAVAEARASRRRLVARVRQSWQPQGRQPAPSAAAAPGDAAVQDAAEAYALAAADLNRHQPPAEAAGGAAAADAAAFPGAAAAAPAARGGSSGDTLPLFRQAAAADSSDDGDEVVSGAVAGRRRGATGQLSNPGWLLDVPFDDYYEDVRYQQRERLRRQLRTAPECMIPPHAANQQAAGRRGARLQLARLSPEGDPMAAAAEGPAGSPPSLTAIVTQVRDGAAVPPDTDAAAAAAAAGPSAPGQPPVDRLGSGVSGDVRRHVAAVAAAHAARRPFTLHARRSAAVQLPAGQDANTQQQPRAVPGQLLSTPEVAPPAAPAAADQGVGSTRAEQMQRLRIRGLRPMVALDAALARHMAAAGRAERQAYLRRDEQRPAEAGAGAGDGGAAAEPGEGSGGAAPVTHPAAAAAAGGGGGMQLEASGGGLQGEAADADTTGPAWEGAIAAAAAGVRRRDCVGRQARSSALAARLTIAGVSYDVAACPAAAAAGDSGPAAGGAAAQAAQRSALHSGREVRLMGSALWPPLAAATGGPLDPSWGRAPRANADAVSGGVEGRGRARADDAGGVRGRVSAAREASVTVVEDGGYISSD